MRVISGIARSAPLISPKGEKTRPTLDQIKETLFNILQGYVENSEFLDLFAGSGQIGIEALSRSAKSATFVENSEEAIKCIRANLTKTKLEDRARILKKDVFNAINEFENSKQFDLIFIDPPYNTNLSKECLIRLSSSNIVKNNTLIIIEEDKKTDFSYVDALGFIIKKDKIYKSNRHIFLAKR